MNPSLTRRALCLSYFTVAYNLAEGVISILLGVLARSVALVGFGLDSFVEALSGGVMVWRFRQAGSLSEEEEERREARAIKLVGWTFLILGGYVLYESVTKLYYREAPEGSLWGIVLALVSLIVMPGLAHLKRRTGEAIGSASLVADSKETLACAWLSLALLLGLGLNYLFGLWWADPVAGLVIVVFLLREGYELLRGEGCECATCVPTGD